MSLYCVDIETSGLLNDSTVDYTASPWKLRDNFKIHCIVIESLETGEVFEFVGDDCSKFKDFVLNTNITGIIAHNGISFDLTVLKVAYGMDFELGFEDSPSKWCGKEVEIIDTLMLSKTLFPDRQGHSLDYLGNLCGVKKIDWRAQAIELGLIEYSAEKGDEFLTYHPKMLEYNKQDVKTNIAVYKMLMKEKREWGKWDDAIQLEQYVAWIISRQEHRGFWFDRELADKNVRELDALMLEHKNIVEPHLPQKPLGKTKLKEYTAPATQFKKDGTPSSHIEKFIARHGGELQNRIDGYYAVFENKEFQLPLLDPIKTHEDALISDSTFIKEFLVGIGWEPSEFKEKDLTLDVKKRKLSAEKFKETVQRYVDKTLASNFCKFRLTKVNATRDALLNKLLRHDMSKPLKVLTNPTFTVGQEKQIDPALERLVDTFPYVKNIVEYLTYNHRRNSILGGGFDIEDEEEAETGFIPNMRSDGRIPTPADSCGCATARMKHRIICNIPRVTSLYGAPIRALFGVGAGNGAIQFAYDFCSLEAMIESHYCWKYDMTENKEYCNSLIQEKPNDVHTLTAKKISEMLGREFSRGSSKAVKYACVPMDTQILTRSGWKHYDDIIIGEEVLGYDEKTKTKKWTKLLHKFKKQDEVIELTHNWFNVRATKDHRWFVKQRREFSTGKPDYSIRRAIDEVRTTEELNSESSIIMNAPMDSTQDNETSGVVCLSEKKYGRGWSERVLSMSQAERVSFLEGFMVADGYHNRGKWQWSQNMNELYEAALIASYLVHDGVVCVSTRQTPTNILKTAILTNKSHRGLQTVSKKSLGVQDVWCVTTELGSWVMRQGDTITITGNCAYGAQAPKVAKTIGSDLTTGELVFEGYWEAAKPLADLKIALTKYWETKGGKKFILGIDGRKIMTRSKHSLVNALFQSAGVICAKRTMVYQDVAFREAGISVDFWKEDWKNKDYIQQLIAYHK